MNQIFIHIHTSQVLISPCEIGILFSILYFFFLCSLNSEKLFKPFVIEHDYIFVLLM